MNRKKTDSFLRRAAVLLAAGWTASALLGCGGGGGDAPPPVTVTVNAPAAAIKIGETQTYSATVTGTSNTGVTWSVTGSGCTGAACGTISSAGLYTAPGIVPQPPAVSIVATSIADTTKRGTAPLTIGSDVAVATWPQAARVTLNNSRQFLHMLTGAANTAVTWSVTGAGCATADCGSVVGGRYVAPAAMPPNTSTVFVVATSVVDRGKTAQAAVTLQASNLATVNGTYAFLNRGFSLGAWGVSAGAFVADANGSLAAGVLDRALPVAAGGKLVALPYGGRYTLDNDNRGDFVLALPAGDNAWRMTVSASGNKFYMQPVFNTEVRGMAAVYKQDPAAFTNAAVNGTYVFLLDGYDIAGTHLANIGRFTANGAGAISAGQLDSTDGSNLFSTQFTGTYNVSSNGRAPVQLVMGTGTYNFALYVVNADLLILVSNDDVVAGVPARIGLAYRQTGGPFAPASLSGNYVFELAGRNSATSAIATVGRFSSDGAGNVSGRYDRNSNYAITLDGTYSATYTLDSAGRGTLGSAVLGQMVFYMASPDRVLMVEMPGARVQTGTLERQMAAPYTTAGLVGEFAQGMAMPNLLSSMTVTARVFYDGAGTESSVQEHNAALPCGLSSGSSVAPYSVSPTGRIAVTDGAGNPVAAGHLVNPGRYVLLLQRPSGSACDEVVHHYFAEQ